MILIDTNVYSASNRGNLTAINFMKSSSSIVVPVVVIAELRAGFLGGQRNELNNELLNKFIADEKVQIATSSLNTTEHYAYLFSYSKKRGKILSNNDLWIASTALENDLKLVTFDKDFEVFSELFGEKLLILDN